MRFSPPASAYRLSLLAAIALAASGCNIKPRCQPADGGHLDGGYAAGDGGVEECEEETDGGHKGFDPSGVLMLGTLAEGSCGRDALAALGAPTRPLVGFDCNASPGILTPSGAYIYLHGGLPRTFVNDPLFFDGRSRRWTYPDNPTANDQGVATPGCDLVEGLLGDPYGPSGLVYRCRGVWQDKSGPVAEGCNLQAWNPTTGVFLGFCGSGLSLIDRDGQRVPVTGDVQAALYRSHGTGFWAANQEKLWSIDAEGSAKQEGEYSGLPPDTESYFSSCKLDGAGDLFCQGRDTRESFIDVVVRRSVRGASEIVYTERNAPRDSTTLYVKLHISYLVTGQ